MLWTHRSYCKMILLLAGTSDAKELGLSIKDHGFPLISTVVSQNASKEWAQMGIPVHVGRLTDEAMTHFIIKNKITTVVDASHPFAEEASKNAIRSAAQCEIPYIRYERKSQELVNPVITYVHSYEEAAELASKKKGVIFLTTGSKTLPLFAEKLLLLPDVRMMIRLLPREDNLRICEELNIPQQNIVAIQGPFSKEFNKALFTLYDVNIMITKESGDIGSFKEKVSAAVELGIETIVIKRPAIEYGTVYQTFTEVIQHLQQLGRNGQHDRF